MSALGDLIQSSFDDIKFPVEKCSIKGEQRIHTHEYPKTPGGLPEKLSRKNYMMTVNAFFVQGTVGYSDTLWPDDLALLRVIFETGKTATLHYPTIGDIQAVMRTLDVETDFKSLLNGERVVMTFEEDQSTEFLVDGIVNVTTSSFQDTAAAFFPIAKNKAPGLFDQLNALVNSIIGLVDTVQLYGSLLQNQLNSLMQMLSFLDATASPLNATTNSDLLEAFMALRLSSKKLQADSQRASAKLVPYTTPMVMSIGDVSRALYGSSANATKLLKLNSFEDPLAIPANYTLVAIAA